MRPLLLSVALLVGCGNTEPAKPEPAKPAPTAPGPATRPAPDAGPATPKMPEVANAAPGFLYVKGADYEGVIADGAGPWTPSPQDVAVVELALGPAISAHQLGKDHPAKDFKRQYGGVEVAGARVIRVLLACDTPDGWPAKGVPSMRGGGTCYGAADFDVASGTLTRLDANSPR